MKLILFADNSVGLEIFNYLVTNYFSDVKTVVVTEENNAIFQASKLKNIHTEVFDSGRDYSSHQTTEYDLGILAWWPYIIKEHTLKIATQGFINFHPSYLPYNRGKHYNFWALVEQAPFGVSLHKVVKEVDAGDIVCQKQISYNWEDTGESLYFKAKQEIVNLFVSNYPDIRAGKIVTKPQDLSLGSFHFAAEINEASKIDLNKVYLARELLNLLRARTFKGNPSCWFEADDGQEYEVRVEIIRKS